MKFYDLEQDLKAAISCSIPNFVADMANKDMLTLDNSNTNDNLENNNANGLEAKPLCWASADKHASMLCSKPPNYIAFTA